MAFQVTVSDLLTAALRLNNVVGQDRDPTAAELNDALYALNEQMDASNIDGAMVYARQYVQFPLSNGTLTTEGMYFTLGAIGSGAQWLMPAGQDRPTNIQFATYQVPVNPPINVPLRILTAYEWSSIRATQVQTTIPTWMYIDEGYPVAKVYIWPVPIGGSTVTFDVWTQLQTNLTLSTVLQMPPGYAKWMRYEVAAAISDEYSLPLSPNFEARLEKVRKDILIGNITSPDLVYDTAPGPGVYNVLTDELY
jgi:hypothetical protein